MRPAVYSRAPPRAAAGIVSAAAAAFITVAGRDAS